MSVDLVLSLLALLVSFVSVGFTVATVRRARQNLRELASMSTVRAPDYREEWRR